MKYSFTFRVVGGTIAGFAVAALLSLPMLSTLLDRFLVQRVDHSIKSELLDMSAILGYMREPYNQDLAKSRLLRHGHTRGVNHYAFCLFDTRGGLLAASDLENWPSLRGRIRLDPERRADIESKLFSWKTQTLKERPWGVRVGYMKEDDGRILEVSVDLKESTEILSRARWIYAIVMGAVFLFGSLLGWLATRRPLSGIKSVGRAAAMITENADFTGRVASPTGSAETDQLAEAFNAMSDRIAGLIESQKEIMDNIAHDIRSPVARMRAAAEANINAMKDLELSGQVIEDCDRIMNLVNTLLDISAAEAGTLNWADGPVNPADLIREAAELFGPILEMKGHQLEMDLEAVAVINTDESVLQRLIANLLDNAVKYTPDEGLIRIILTDSANGIIITVQDTGIGIAADVLPRVFQKFYRAEASRNAPGTGLGLSFCKAAVVAMGGRITCESTLGQGTRFDIFLPRKKRLSQAE